MATVSLSTSRITSELSRVIVDFQQEQKTRPPHTPIRITTASGLHYYGIHKASQKTPDSLADLKKIIHITLKLNPENKIVQVIGDTCPFGSEGTRIAYDFLKIAISINDYVLYGYTGLINIKSEKCANALTSSFLTDHNLLDNGIGSVVGYQTNRAFLSGCSAPDLNHYVVVYGDDETRPEGSCLFGEAIDTSDFLADRFILLEGNIQSFAQACNALAMEKPIRALSLIRHVPSRVFFSASRFLYYIKSYFEKYSSAVATPKLLNELKDCFLRLHPIADVGGRYYPAKLRSFNTAWTFFVENRLHEKLHLFKNYTPKDFQ